MNAENMQIYTYKLKVTNSSKNNYLKFYRPVSKIQKRRSPDLKPLKQQKPLA